MTTLQRENNNRQRVVWYKKKTNQRKERYFPEVEANLCALYLEKEEVYKDEQSGEDE